MAHNRLDDKRIELNTGQPRTGTGDEAQVRLDAGQERGTLATLEVVTEGAEEESVHRRRAALATSAAFLSGERVPGDRALNPDTAVRFRRAKVIFRSEPEIVNADGETVLLVIQDC